MNRTDCGACGGTDLHTFLDLGKTPLANSFPDAAALEAGETYYGLGLCRCRSCGLVQNTETIPDELIYGDDYGFYSGGSPAQLAYHAAGARLLLSRYGERTLRVVEIACNDGSLLQHFADAGHRALGVDPAAPAAVALRRGLEVLQQPFTAELGRRIRDVNGPADLIIAYNSLAHINDLSDVLTGIWALIASDGRAVVEVQYLGDMLAGNMYDQVYHEHRYFHSLTSFERAAALHNLKVIDAELIELQNGGIRFTLTPAQNPTPPTNRVIRIRAYERWLEDERVYDGVQGRVDRIRDHLLAILSRFLTDGEVVAGYAAAAKATTVLNFCGLGVDDIPYVCDATEQKWGRHVPGTGIPIVPPERIQHADVALLLSPNYLGHALRAHADWFANGGRWVVPIPAPAVIG